MAGPYSFLLVLILLIGCAVAVYLAYLVVNFLRHLNQLLTESDEVLTDKVSAIFLALVLLASLTGGVIALVSG